MTIPKEQAPGVPQELKRALRLTRAREIKPERVRWLWRMRVPLRGLTVVAGEGGLGKSMLTSAHLVSEITHGLLDGDVKGARDVLIASAEDDWAAVIVPRLMAAGADLDRVHRVAISDPGGDEMLTLPDDIQRIERACNQLASEGSPVALLVIDPVGAFLSDSTDSHRDASVRRALAPIASMAERLDAAVIVIAHLNKDDAQKIVARVNGSVAFGNAARSVIAFARHPDDPEGEQGRERVIVHAKTNWGNYAPTLIARVESRVIDIGSDESTEVGILVVLGESEISADDIGRRSEDTTGAIDCSEEIIAALMDGGRSGRQVKATVTKALGCSRRTVERAATRMQENGELVIERVGFPATTTWALASCATSLTPPGDATAQTAWESHFQAENTVATPSGVRDMSRLQNGANSGNGRSDDARRAIDRMLGERDDDDLF